MPHSTKLNIKLTPLSLAVLVLGASLSWLALVNHASAAQFGEAFVRLDRLTAETTTGGRVCAEPSTVSTEASVQVMFPTTNGTDYVVNGTASNWTVDTSDLDSGQTAWPGIGTATDVTSKTVTFPSGDLTVGTLYCFNFSATSTLTTSSAGASETIRGTITTRTSAPANIDQTTYSQSIITNDQIVVSAVVPPSFSFALSANTDSFLTDLSTSGVVATNGRNVTITTNAASGWIVWVRDLNDNGSGIGALRSATAGNYNLDGTVAPGSTRTLVGGTEDYGMGVTIANEGAGGGTITADAAYATTTSEVGSLDPTQFRPVASASGTATGDAITLTMRAAINGQTPAASDYTDTLTVVGAGRF